MSEIGIFSELTKIMSSSNDINKNVNFNKITGLEKTKSKDLKIFHYKKRVQTNNFFVPILKKPLNQNKSTPLFKIPNKKKENTKNNIIKVISPPKTSSKIQNNISSSLKKGPNKTPIFKKKSIQETFSKAAKTQVKDLKLSLINTEIIRKSQENKIINKTSREIKQPILSKTIKRDSEVMLSKHLYSDNFSRLNIRGKIYKKEEEIKEVNNIISTRSFNEEKLIDLQQTRNNSNEDLEGELEMENFLLTSMEKKNIPIKKSYHQNNLNIVYLLNKKKQIF